MDINKHIYQGAGWALHGQFHNLLMAIGNETPQIIIYIYIKNKLIIYSLLPRLNMYMLLVSPAPRPVLFFEIPKTQANNMYHTLCHCMTIKYPSFGFVFHAN